MFVDVRLKVSFGLEVELTFAERSHREEYEQLGIWRAFHARRGLEKIECTKQGDAE